MWKLTEGGFRKLRTAKRGIERSMVEEEQKNYMFKEDDGIIKHKCDSNSPGYTWEGMMEGGQRISQVDEKKRGDPHKVGIWKWAVQHNFVIAAMTKL